MLLQPFQQTVQGPPSLLRFGMNPGFAERLDVASPAGQSEICRGDRDVDPPDIVLRAAGDHDELGMKETSSQRDWPSDVAELPRNPRRGCRVVEDRAWRCGEALVEFGTLCSGRLGLDAQDCWEGLILQKRAAEV